jgi:hypothetical protein
MFRVMKRVPKFARKPQKSPLIPLFKRGKQHLLPLAKGGWEGFLGILLKTSN